MIRNYMVVSKSYLLLLVHNESYITEVW